VGLWCLVAERRVCQVLPKTGTRAAHIKLTCSRAHLCMTPRGTQGTCARDMAPHPGHSGHQEPNAGVEALTCQQVRGRAASTVLSGSPSHCRPWPAQRHGHWMSGKALPSAPKPELASGTKLALYVVTSKNKNWILPNQSSLSINISNRYITEELLHIVSKGSFGNRWVGGNFLQLYQPGLSDQRASLQIKEVIHKFE